MLAPVGPAAKRLARFALLALLAFAATQWPHASSWAVPVATAPDPAVLEVKCVPLSIQSAGLSATAAGCSAAAGSGTRPQSGYSVEPHSSATADGGSDCQLDCERAGHAHLDVTALGIQTKESRCLNERLPDNNHAPEAVKEGCFKEQTSYTNHAPEDVVQFDKNFSADIDAATRFLHDLDRGLEVPWLLGDHRVAHPGVCNDAGSPSHTSTDVVAEVLGSTGTCATARHFSSFLQKSISLLLVFFSVSLRSLGALSFKAQATTSSRGHRLTQPTSISGLGGWDPGNAGRIASAATDSSRGAGFGPFAAPHG